eukprot:8280667-Alexandrium_andersonii.AAC.1
MCIRDRARLADLRAHPDGAPLDIADDARRVRDVPGLLGGLVEPDGLVLKPDDLELGLLHGLSVLREVGVLE